MTAELRDGLRLLSARRWYEAHEAFEMVWLGSTGERRDFAQGLLHVAVSFEHLRRGNPRGALSQWRKARARLAGGAAWSRELDLQGWLAAVEEFYARIDLERGAAAPPPPGEASWPVPAGDQEE